MLARHKTLSDLDKKIARLQEKQETLRTKEALLLLKECEKFFGGNSSIDLVLTILIETWKKASPDQQKEWQNKARTFRTPSPKRKSSHKTASAPSGS